MISIKKVYRVLNYFEHFLVFVFAVSKCVSISVLASLICALTARIIKYKSVIKKKRKKLENIVLLAKATQNTIKILISTVLTQFRMGLFEAAHRCRGGRGRRKGPLPKIFHTYLSKMKLGSYKHGYNFDDSSKIGYSRPSQKKYILK